MNKTVYKENESPIDNGLPVEIVGIMSGHAD